MVLIRVSREIFLKISLLYSRVSPKGARLRNSFPFISFHEVCDTNMIYTKWYIYTLIHHEREFLRLQANIRSILLQWHQKQWKSILMGLWRHVMTLWHSREIRFEINLKNPLDWYIASQNRINIASMASKTVKNRSLRGYDVTWWRHNTNMKSDLNSNYKILWIDILQAYIGSILLLWHQK